MRLAFNAWSLLSPHTGIASYTRNLAEALQEREDVQLHFFYGHNWDRNIRETHLPYMNPLKTWVKRLVPNPYAMKRFLQQKAFDRGIHQHDFDVYHEPAFFPFFFKGPTVITIHDLSPLHFPETHPQERVREFHKQIPIALEQAGAVITPTVFVRQEIIEIYKVAPEKIRAISLGVSPIFYPRSEEDLRPVMRKYNLSAGQYILAVGTVEPRKNLLQTIDAYTALPQALRSSIPLVVAGMRGWLAENIEARIRQCEERGELRWLGYVPQDELPLLYSGAIMLVFPSIYEGFGLPVLEAMACGIPVITSTRASLPEVAGEVGIMIDPADIDALRDSMKELLEDSAKVGFLGKKGIERAGRFTWSACAEETLAVYDWTRNR